MPLWAARLTLQQFSISTELFPVSDREMRSMTAPPLSATQNTPRPPPRAMTSPTRMLAGQELPTRPFRLAMRKAA